MKLTCKRKSRNGFGDVSRSLAYGPWKCNSVVCQTRGVSSFAETIEMARSGCPSVGNRAGVLAQPPANTGSKSKGDTERDHSAYG